MSVTPTTRATLNQTLTNTEANKTQENLYRFNTIQKKESLLTPWKVAFKIELSFATADCTD